MGAFIDENCSLPISYSFIFAFSLYISLLLEDCIVEYMQVIFYFTSSIIAFLVSIKFLRNKITLNGVLYGILAIGLLFISLEEMSWGQRIFNIANPVYFEQYNNQHEISLHNLDIAQRMLDKIYIIIGAYGAFAWIFVSLFLSKAKGSYRYILDYVVPDWFISTYFFSVFFIYTLFSYISQPYPGSFLEWKDQEPMELLLSLGFFCFVATNYVKLTMPNKRI